MKKHLLVFGIFTSFGAFANAQEFDPQKYIIENEKNIGKEQPGPHKGGGESIGYSFFSDVKDYKTAFRKRVLKPGAAIGYHQQKEDEVYYVLSGNGEMKLNDKIYNVKDGDAILTRTGSWHGITNKTKQDLVLIIVYDKH
ncbi:Cupin 2 conserved barrel domain protein [Pseudopedobacter saltans DSM 12145]|uniref:Cupin 2 conserved barrel domain protein n=1 Tax=Pseudopedobacter saltans (strain ATCC 51119 / DSM 12145 / JCM 21818 / CCUG 39354 / LMG 10337 / NBRC 100064 / NCIMB 13643) TaxID=762903 RepID=F0S9S1_PSESL|nr:cupin domain-containing protein [Pseudopedobacter saltans]ADY51427.1 Cupin 2 conserved barrel domain protein [Pseudopedobacter saltans DSM 12145]